ncbi:response regulator [Caulobacter sp. FWC2]|uniref:response regulator n=1 Tax=Caulobacter sp. FWC2 TaxID=69664 RepID=UPI000C15D6BD|nr:response regulator [Caulobacter sp. FWC2]PIB92570.1 hypothetical protein CSW62_13920 [Caulobacter sp. FWC2]
MAPLRQSGPPPLVGRAAELEAVRVALGQRGVRAIVAHGAGGVGKTALLRHFLETAAQDGAIVGAGKYPEGRDGRDLDPIVAAVEAAITAGLDQLYDPEAGLRSLAQALGENARVLAGVGSGLLRALAETGSGPRVTAEEGEAQIGRALLRVLRWLEGFGAPVFLMIDDWGRGGQRAQRFCGLLLSDSGLKLTRLLATERDDETAESERLIGLVRIAVDPLGADDRLELARLSLGERRAAAADILAFVGPAAARPFDLIESTRVLIAADAVVNAGGTWRLDTARAASALAGAAAISAVRQALASAPEAEAVARALAVHGDGAQASDLARACGFSEIVVRHALARLADNGLVQWSCEGAEFAHDRLRAEVLLGAPPSVRVHLAEALAEALRAGGVAPGDGARSMTMLWLRQEAGLRDAEPIWWRDAFTTGAVKARATGDRVAAERFVASAMQLAAVGPGETYPLLAEAAFVAITQGQDAEARRFVDRLELFATTPIERAVAEEMRVFARRATGDLDGALEVARAVLTRRGVKVPRGVTAWSLTRALMRILSMDPRKATKPLEADRLALEAPMMRAINGLGSLMFERDPRLAVVLATQTLSRDLIYGTAAAAGTYSLMCCAMGDYRRAAAWAEASDRLQRPEQPLRAVAKQYSASFGHVFARPRPVTRARGDEATALAYIEGDLAVAAYGNRDKVLDALFCDDPLDDTTALADRAIEVAIQLGEPATIPHVQSLRQFIAQLRQPDRQPWRLDGDHFDAPVQLARLRDEGLANVGRAIAALEALLAVLFGAHAEAARIADRPWPQFSGSPFQGQSQIWGFATSLAFYRTGRRPRPFVRWNLKRLSRLNPNDFLHRERLLAAEHARIAGRRRQALGAYAEAVEAAAVSRCLLEYGLVAISASQGADLLGASAEASRWREAARGAWRRLGADALLSHWFGETPEAQEKDVQRAVLARTAAERASQAKSRLLATVGHELRGPLQGALSLIDLAEAREDQADLPTLRRAIHHLAGMVDDLTNLGALDGGVLVLRKAAFDAAGLASAVVALQRPAAEAAGRTLALETPGAPLWVLGDEGRLGQVLGNLVANALRHGQGRVSVSLASTAPDRLTLLVADEGPALGEAEAMRIFEPFDRGGRGGDETGLGVGLFLGRSLARAMGGDLTTRPLPHGKAFALEIEAPAAAAPTVTSDGGISGLRVLLAEDIDLSRKTLAALLRSEGCIVDEAATGEAARALAAAGPFDLLLLDQHMGAVTGLDVAAFAARLPTSPRVILMTAETSPELIGQARDVGVDLVLAKPISLAALRGAARTKPSPAKGRRVELGAALGDAAAAILAALRPAIEYELDQLERAVAAEDADAVRAQLHRLRGMAAHFGLELMTRALNDVSLADPTMISQLRAATARVDWSAIGSVGF